MIRSDLHAEEHGAVLREGIAAAEGPVWVVNPTGDTITELLTAFREGPPVTATPVRLLAASDPLKRIADDFVRASQAAELVTDGRLELRTLDAVPRHSLLLTKHAIVSLVECGGHVAGLTTTQEKPVSATYSAYMTRWEGAEEFSLRTPPLSAVRQTLTSEFGPGVADEFDRALAALDTQRGQSGAEDVFDEVVLALLVAAHNRELLYDISRWGEEIELASKATFSRGKTRLEEAGLVGTEKVPIDVGRPRLRLVPAEPLAGADIERFVEEAYDRLA